MLKNIKIISEMFGGTTEMLYICSVRIILTLQIYKKMSHIMMISNKNLKKYGF